MIFSPANMDITSIYTGDPLHTETNVHWTVDQLTYWDLNVSSFQLLREILKVLDENPQVPGVLILEHSKLVGLIPREKIYEKLGRPYGVELFLKKNAKQFYELMGVSTLVLSWEMTIDNAVNMALMRPQEMLYEPIVVDHPDGYRFISMLNLLLAQQTIQRELYSKIHHLSTIDPLTHINNRRGFFEMINPHLATIRLQDLEYAVMMIDIDNFKKINDRYGHQIGDEVIRSVAQRIAAQIRSQDVMGRFGGEEFVVFMMDISKDSASDLAESVRQDVASYFHTINSFQIRVTISIGISHSMGANRTFDRLLTEADQSVYIAKNKGRNRVVTWSEGMKLSTNGHGMFRVEQGNATQHSEQTSSQILQGLLRLLYLRDSETEAHTLRVTEMTLKLAQKAQVPEDSLEGIRIGALLHDIGKISIPDKILLKQGKLTKAEFEIIQRHPQYAYDLLAPISYFHHEHWNGQGYPRGVQGNEIPLAARIFTIVDVWDALSSDRPYRPAWKEEKIRDFLVKQSGILFDASLVPLFLDLLESISGEH
ncbi:MAG: diguanylate cyclase [Chloroflexota bacterium]